jgi:tRNA A58 N-methylase Trm61
VRYVFVPLSLLLAVPCTFPGVPEESDGIVASLALAPGMTVADVGAGDGKYSVVLARSVGPGGRVYATEVDASDVEKISSRADGEGLRNLTTVVGSQEDTGLPAGSCDAILLRMVYHHFTDTAAMRRSLWSAVKPGGRIVIIDVPPQKSWRHLDGVPERGGHGIAIAELIADMTRSGFEVVARDEDWPAEPDAYLVVFRRPQG